MTDLQIRNAHADERPTMQQITIDAYSEYAAIMPATAWQEYRANILATVGEDETAERIVALHEGRIVGSVLLYPAGLIIQGPTDEPITLPAPEVRLLAVPPINRQHGIGAALLEECINRARAVGMNVITLHTTDMMQTAMQMYERRGFVRNPAADIPVQPGIVVKGYRLDLQSETTDAD